MNLTERNEKQRTFFNEKITSYDDTHQEFMKTKEDLANSLDKDTKKILDLGAGTGLELIHLFELFPDAEVTTIDISEEMLKKLKERTFGPKLRIICGDFFEVEFGSNFDAIISTSALHHFTKEEKEKLYKKIYECLREGGLFVNCDKIAITQEDEDFMFSELETNAQNYKHIDTPLTVANEVKILTSTGFSSTETSKTDKDNYCLIKSRK